MDDLDADQRLKLDQLDEEYRRRHGAAVDLLKQQVGEGDLYGNAAARAMVSPNGAWCELADLPMEFSGLAGGPTLWRFVGDADALALLERLRPLVEAAAGEERRAGLLELYTRRGLADERGVYTVDCSGGGPARRIGAQRAGELPLVYRVRLSEPAPVAGLSFRQGVVFCLTGIGERCLVIELPHDVPDSQDLGRHAGRDFPS